jgi:hypothetical protein
MDSYGELARGTLPAAPVAQSWLAVEGTDTAAQTRGFHAVVVL